MRILSRWISLILIAYEGFLFQAWHFWKQGRMFFTSKKSHVQVLKAFSQTLCSSRSLLTPEGKKLLVVFTSIVYYMRHREP